jgi:small subunit ribosomal protein S15
MLSAQKKKNIVKKLGKTEKDTGRVEVQVGILTKKIEELSKHLKTNKKDVHGRRGLIQMISTRRKHMKYLQTKSPKRYTAMVKELGL